MKKKLIFVLILILFLPISITSCTLADVDSLQTEDYSLNDITFNSETFIYDGTNHSIKISGTIPTGVKVTYENNGQKNVGKYTVKATLTKNGVTLLTKTATLTIKKAPLDLDEITFDDMTYDYDGNIPDVKISGELPKDIGVTYSSNLKAEPGIYKVNATLTDYSGRYESKTLTAKVTIKAPFFDSKKISFENQEFVYDGEEHNLAISGDLPDYVTVSYENNAQTEVGIYKVTAKFTIDIKFIMYVPAISDKTATLVIVASEKDLSGIKFESKSYTYDGEFKSLEALNVPDGISVTYENNDKINVGDYIVTAHFKSDDGKTYPDLEATLSITKANYDMSEVEFNDESFVFDNTPHSIEVKNLPNTLVAIYENNDKINVGKYKVTVKFKTLNDNYYEPEDMEATLSITKPTFDESTIKFEDKEFIYDGEAHSIYIDNELPDYIKVEYENNEATTIGNYRVIAKFIIDDDYKELIPAIKTKIATLSIIKDPSIDIIFDDEEFVYDGNIKSLTAKNAPDGVGVEYINNGKILPGEYRVTAKFTSNDGKAYPDMEATLNIIKASYDISNMTFADETFVFDNNIHTITVKNIPDGVKVEYENNDKINVGKYEVTAKFIIEDENYNKIADMKANITIVEPTFDASSIKFESEEVVYDGESHAIYIKGTLPDYITVSYEGNDVKTIGNYDITANFEVADAYKDLIPEIKPKQATLSIVASEDDISGIEFVSASFTYDGNKKSLLAKNVPEGVEVSYEENDKIDVGEYTVIAHFTSAGDKIYSDKKATLSINKAEIDMSMVEFPDLLVSYDGLSHRIDVKNLPDNVDVTYTGNDKVDVGNYTVVAAFTSLDDNYNNPEAITAELKIVESKVEIKFIADNHVYDGFEHGITFEGELPEGVTIKGIDEKYINAGTYHYNIVISSTDIEKLTNYSFIIENASKDDNDTEYNLLYGMNLVIDKATYDYSKIKLDAGSFKYVGGKYSIGLSQKLDNDILVSYEFGDDNVVENTDGTLSGIVTIKMSFSITNPNYNLIPDMLIDIDLSEINNEIIFDVDGGDPLENNVLSISDLAASGGAPVPTKEDSRFLSWVYIADDEEEIELSFNDMLSTLGSITLKAKWTDSYTTDMVYKLSDDSSYYILTSLGNVVDTEIYIPEIYNGLPVKEIGNNVFYNKNIQGVVISNNITKIGKYNFYNCSNLEYLVIGENVEELSNCVISYLPLLKTLEFKGNNIKTIGGDSFNKLPLIEGIDLSEQNLISISSKDSYNQCFSNNEKLKYVKLPKTLEYLDGYSFRNNASTFDIIIDSDNPNYEKVNHEIYTKDHNIIIYYNNNSSARDYTLAFPSVTKSIGAYAFYNTNNLMAFRTNDTGDITLEEIGTHAFYGSKVIKFSAYSAKKVDTYAFANCKNLVLLNTFIPNIEYFGTAAFSESNMAQTSIKFLKVKYMGPDVFAGTDLSYVDLSMISSPVFRFDNASNLTEVLFTPNLTEIPDYAFEYCSNLTTLSLGGYSNNITKVGKFAFAYSGITNINFPNLKEAGFASFAVTYSSDTTTTISVPKLEKAHAFAFYNRKITSITLPNIIYIGLGAFDNEDALSCSIDARGSQDITIEKIRSDSADANYNGEIVVNYYYPVNQNPMEIIINSSQKVYVSRVISFVNISFADTMDQNGFAYPIYAQELSYGFMVETEGLWNQFEAMISLYSILFINNQDKALVNTLNKYVSLVDLYTENTNTYHSNSIKVTVS